MIDLIISFGRFTGLEMSISHNIPSPWSDCQKPAYFHVFQNTNPNVTAFMVGACSSKISICVLKRKPVLGRKSTVCCKYPTWFHISALRGNDQFQTILLELFYTLDFRFPMCRSSHVQTLEREMLQGSGSFPP